MISFSFLSSSRVYYTCSPIGNKEKHKNFFPIVSPRDKAVNLVTALNNMAHKYLRKFYFFKKSAASTEFIIPNV